MRFKKSLYFFLPFIWFSASGQRIIPKEVNLVSEYLNQKDCPEKFGDKSFPLRVIDWQIIDIDDDGILEVFLQTFPHYLQSPPITIFQISKNDSVTRMLEGFAPGRLLPLAENRDYYFDSHTMGLANDSYIERADSLTHRKFGLALIEAGTSAVIYKQFIHSDNRSSAVFADLRYLGAYNHQRKCDTFQFAKPDEIIAGRVRGSYHKNFIARVDDELFCYEILGFDSNQFVKKKIRIVRVPADFEVLIHENGFVKYRTKSGEVKDFRI
jgi:hypothetical protein